MHALWNLLLAGASDARAATGAAMVLGVLVCAPVLFVGGSVSGGALPWIVASSALELAYFALLGLAYSRGELSAVYPLARGSAPVLVLLVSVVFLGVSLSAVAALGVLLVGAGVLLVRGPVFSDALLALAVGGCIAGYTLVDNEGLRHADPLPYLWLVLVVPALVYAGWLGRRRVVEAVGWRTLAAGVGMFAAYALTLAALRLAPAAPVAAVRETSIVVGVALGFFVLRESVGSRQFAGASVIVGGVGAIALA